MGLALQGFRGWNSWDWLWIISSAFLDVEDFFTWLVQKQRKHKNIVYACSLVVARQLKQMTRHSLVSLE